MADPSGILYQHTIVNNPAPIVQSSTTVLAANPARSSFFIQNQATTVLYICFQGTASATQYHAALKACTNAADGNGGSISNDTGALYTGAITCYSTSTPSYTVLEI